MCVSANYGYVELFLVLQLSVHFSVWFCDTAVLTVRLAQKLLSQGWKKILFRLKKPGFVATNKAGICRVVPQLQMLRRF